MYAPALIAQAQARLERVYQAALPQGLRRYPVAVCHTMAQRLANAVNPAGVPQRRLTPEEDAFVANERLLTKIDFRYMGERYIQIRGAQGLQPLYPLWEPQEIILGRLAALQMQRVEEQHPDGVLVNILKARQHGASTLAQALVAHRVVTHTHVNAMTASDVPENSGSEGQFGKFELIIEHLPWYLKPATKFHKKDTHWVFANGSWMTVESGKSMKGGLQDQGSVKGNLGRSKSQPLDEPVLTPDGWRPMGSLRVGDYVVGSTGQPTRIVGIYPQGIEPVYRVEFTDGSWTRCSENHLWTVQTPQLRKEKRWRTQPLRELATQLRMTSQYGYRYFIPMLEPVQLNTRGSLPIPAYALGLLIGDGGLTHAIHFSSVDEAILNELRQLLPPELILKHRKGCDYGISAKPGQRNGWTLALRQLGLMGKKSTAKQIPLAYLHAGLEDRVALLQGLLDTDGWSTRDGRVLFGTSSEQLAQDVQALVCLLGGTASCNGYTTTRARAYRLDIRLPAWVIPFRLPRKLARLRRRQGPPRRAIRSVTLEGLAETQCIAVEATDQLYATRFGILTHNTFTVAHLTELSTWERPEQIDDGLLPAIPRSPRTLVLKESTAKGRHNWHHADWLEAVRGDGHGAVGGRFVAIFLPWYALQANWLPAPVDWTPDDDTAAHAIKAEREGPKWLGRTVTLRREQLFWYEQTRGDYLRKGVLNKFLEEQAADPEECFQHSGRSIFSPDQLAYLERQRRPMIDCLAVSLARELQDQREADLAQIRLAKTLAELTVRSPVEAEVR